MSKSIDSLGSATSIQGSSYSLAHERMLNVHFATGELAVMELETILTSYVIVPLKSVYSEMNFSAEVPST